MSNLSITPFDFEGKPVRTVRSEDDEPWLYAADVCKSLGYSNVSQTVSTYVDADDRGYIDANGVNIPPISPEYTPGSILVINESGVYALIFGSQKPEAKRFKKWVTSEVLPSIRKTGSYSVQSMTPAEIILMQAQRLVDQERRVKALEDRTSRVEARQNAQDQLNEYFTIKGYASLHRIHVSETEASNLGRNASKYCRKHSIKVEHRKDTDYGLIGAYPEDALNVVFTDWKSTQPLFDE